MKPLTHQELAQQLQAKGLKCTPQRLAIYRALTVSDTHPSAEELYREVKGEYPMLSRNTVYQTLEALTNAGLAQSVRSGRSHTRYDGNSDAHHHMVCLSCNRVEDFHDASLERLAPPSRLRRQYQVLHHRVEFYGYCRSCNARNPRATRAHSHKEDVRHG